MLLTLPHSNQPLMILFNQDPLHFTGIRSEDQYPNLASTHYFSPHQHPEQPPTLSHIQLSQEAGPESSFGADKWHHAVPLGLEPPTASRCFSSSLQPHQLLPPLGICVLDHTFLLTSCWWQVCGWLLESSISSPVHPMRGTSTRPPQQGRETPPLPGGVTSIVKFQLSTFQLTLIARRLQHDVKTW